MNLCLQKIRKVEPRSKHRERIVDTKMETNVTLCSIANTVLVNDLVKSQKTMYLPLRYTLDRNFRHLSNPLSNLDRSNPLKFQFIDQETK